MQLNFRLSVVTLALWMTAASSFGQGTVFTFQGRLSDAGTSVNGDYDLQFSLFDAVTNGAQLGANITIAPVSISNGLFTVALDYGTAAFDGSPRWVQMSVRTNGSVSAYVILNPRQRVTASPYAITAGSATTSLSLTGLLPDSQLSGNIPRLNFNQTFTGTTLFSPSSGAPFSVGSTNKVTSFNADLLDGLDSTAFWKTSGNAGTISTNQFLGTTDNQALEIRVNNLRALRIEPNGVSPNSIGGHRSNSVSPGNWGATIAGGGQGSLPNTIGATFGTISGGYMNGIQLNASQSVVAGGRANVVESNATSSTISGGVLNRIQSGAYLSVVGGGTTNVIGVDSRFGTIGGGGYNAIQNDAVNSVISGGVNNRIETGCFDSAIGGGQSNSLKTNASVSTIAGGGLNMIEEGSFSSTIGGGNGNTIKLGAPNSTIAGGTQNMIGINSWQSVILGGNGNKVFTINGTVGGGVSNAIQIDAWASTVGGGEGNAVQSNAKWATIAGGYSNAVAGAYGFAAGRRAKANHIGTFVWADSTDADVGSTAINQFVARASGGVRFYSDAGATTGVNLPPGGGAFSALSDRAAKTDVRPVEGREILDALSQIPLATWRYKTQDASVRHIGPMAQDFHRAFAVGEDDRHISTIDADGVALAAIQGLDEVVKEKDAKIQTLEDRIAALEKAVASLLEPTGKETK